MQIRPGGSMESVLEDGIIGGDGEAGSVGGGWWSVPRHRAGECAEGRVSVRCGSGPVVGVAGGLYHGIVRGDHWGQSCFGDHWWDHWGQSSYVSCQGRARSFNILFVVEATHGPWGQSTIMLL